IVFDTSRPESARINKPPSERRTDDSTGAGQPANEPDSDWFEESFERAIIMAASLANHFLQEGAEVELLTPDDEDRVESGTGIEHLHKLLRLLAMLEPDQTSEGVEKPSDSRRVFRKGGRSEREPESAVAEIGKYALSSRRKGKHRRRQPDSQDSVQRRGRGLLQLLGEIPVLADERRFKVLITPAPKGSIPANIWRSAHVVFMEDLREERTTSKQEGTTA
ncbi:MAG: hypothetical protein ACREDR_44180, partial [Blastocatellia bacterium]